MSQQITEAFVQQFNSNIMMLSQQKGSRLEPAVRNESQKGNSQFFDRIGSVAAVLRTGRHAQTPQMDTPHSRRMVTLADYEWADLVDNQDKIRMLIDPTSEYAMAAAWAFGRAKDDVVIAAALSNAYGGVAGATPVAHPNTQKYAANDGTAFSNLNMVTLRGVKRIMDQREVEGKRYFACTASQIESLLGQTQVTSSDFNTVQALVKGEVSSFMGFEFIRLERLGLTTSTTATAATGVVGAGAGLSGTNRACFAWAEQGLLLSKGEDFITKMSERDDLGYAMQVYARMSIGATRMEEEQVVEVICKEA
jgi:hypothetical protein